MKMPEISLKQRQIIFSSGVIIVVISFFLLARISLVSAMLVLIMIMGGGDNISTIKAILLPLILLITNISLIFTLTKIETDPKKTTTVMMYGVIFFVTPLIINFYPYNSPYDVYRITSFIFVLIGMWLVLVSSFNFFEVSENISDKK